MFSLLPRGVLHAPLFGSVQGRIAWGFEEPGLVEGVLARARGVATGVL